MATDVPARYSKSSFVTGLAKAKDAAVARARKAKSSAPSTPITVLSTLGGAFAAGAATAAKPSGFMGAPTPTAAGLIGIALGWGMGSPMLINAGTGALCLTAGQIGASMVGQAA